MHRRAFTVGSLSAAAFALGQVARGQDEKSPPAGHAMQGHAGYSKHHMECAEACSDCQRECDRCAIHCASMISHGKEGHHKTLQTCLDCADVCAAAAKIVSRGGPFATDICKSCADICKACAEACRKHDNDPMMAACAKECEACEKACRQMLQTARQTEEVKSSR